MTAEVAVLNRHAVALAADSAVTVRDPGTSSVKIFNSVNKLFQLSHYEPVGAMVYGAAEVAGYPWELLVKEYRKHLDQRQLPFIKHYASDFIEWTETLFADKGVHQLHAEIFFMYHFAAVHQSIVRALDKREAEASSFDPQREIDQAIESHFESLQNLDDHPRFEDISFDQSVRAYKRDIYNARKKILDHFFPALSRPSKKICWHIAHLSIVKILPLQNYSGVVVAGFGGKELFPSIESFRIDAYLHGRLKITEESLTDISHSNGANIVPFAQSDLVELFMEGADRECVKYLCAQYEGLLKQLPDIIAETYFKQKTKRSEVSAQLHEAVEHVSKIARQNIAHKQRTEFVQPVVDVIVSLPKDELAQLAESLVQLTALKRKVSKHPDTVGGPVDVAVISRGEGFIWIKRKHYFDAELNPRFFGRYAYMRNGAVGQQGGDG